MFTKYSKMTKSPQKPNTRGNNKPIQPPGNSTPNTSSGTAQSNNDKLSIQQIIKTNNLLLQQNKEILKKLTDMEIAMQFFSQKYDELKLMFDQTTADNIQLKQTNEAIINKNIELEKQNITINNDINEIKQNEIKKNIVIFGIPNVNDYHSLVLTFNNILKHLNINKDDVDIADIFQKKTRTEQAPIFIKFNNYKNKIDFIQAVKSYTRTNKTNLFTSDIGFVNKNKITVVDQLTEANRRILREATILKGHGYKYIWTWNGKIFVKKHETAEMVVITCMKDIELLKSPNSTI